ncbi:MAG: DNA-3-methyladenine glycosylase [Thermoanaerobaculaceae bacterium]
MNPAPPVTQTFSSSTHRLLEQWQAILLPRGFYQRDTVAVARELLGKLLFRQLPEGLVVVRVMETEAYLGVEDAACHTAGGRRTARNQVMWGEAGHLYVYFTYGMHYCANVVTRVPGDPQAVLLRGGEVIFGNDIVKGRRGGRSDVNGPAKLCQALGLTRKENGWDLTRGEGIFLGDDGFALPSEEILALPRVGVAYAKEAAAWPLRFVIRGFPAVGLKGADGPAKLQKPPGERKPR